MVIKNSMKTCSSRKIFKIFTDFYIFAGELLGTGSRELNEKSPDFTSLV